MARQREAKRARHAPGFYKDLHERSTADLLESANKKGARKHSRSVLTIANADSLPEGCYPLDRVVSKRKKRVRHFEKPVKCTTISVLESLCASCSDSSPTQVVFNIHREMNTLFCGRDFPRRMLVGWRRRTSQKEQ